MMALADRPRAATPASARGPSLDPSQVLRSLQTSTTQKPTSEQRWSNTSSYPRYVSTTATPPDNSSSALPNLLVNETLTDHFSDNGASTSTILDGVDEYFNDDHTLQSVGSSTWTSASTDIPNGTTHSGDSLALLNYTTEKPQLLFNVSDLGSGSDYGVSNESTFFQSEYFLPVETNRSNLLDYINNQTLDESGSGSGSGLLEVNLTDLINLNGSTIMGDLSDYITTESPETLTVLHYSLGEMIIVSILLGILTLWTIFGNFLVLLSLWKFKTLRSMSNLLIGNLAVCDFLLALTVLPMSVVNDVIGHWVFGEVLCNLWLSTDVLYCTASIWSLCVIAMDRFTATTFPVWYRNKRSLRRAVTYIVIVWVFSVVVTVPPLFGWQDKSKNYQFNNDTETYMCILFSNMEYVIYSASGSFIIPLFLQLSLYAKIFMILRERSQQMKRAYKRTQANRQPQRVSVRKPPREIELSQVSRNDDSKFLFCEESSPDFETRSDVDDEEVNVAIVDTERCLFQKTPVTGMHHLVETAHRNGMTTDATTDSDTLVIHNPVTRVTDTEKESQSDQEKVTLMKNKKKNTQSSDSASNKPKAFSTAIKQANPFKRDKPHRTSIRKFDKREQRATQRMGIIITCFAVCWLPFLFMYLIRSLCASCPELNPNAQAFLIWLGYANSGLNPILYTIFNEDFRQAFYKLVCCCLEKPKNPQSL